MKVTKLVSLIILILIMSTVCAMENVGEEDSIEKGFGGKKPITVLLKIDRDWGGTRSCSLDFDAQAQMSVALTALKAGVSIYAKNIKDVILNVDFNSPEILLKKFDQIEKDDKRPLAHWIDPGGTIELIGRGENVDKKAPSNWSRIFGLSKKK